MTDGQGYILGIHGIPVCRRQESDRFSLKVELDCVEMQGRRASESGFNPRAQSWEYMKR